MTINEAADAAVGRIAKIVPLVAADARTREVVRDIIAAEFAEFVPGTPRDRDRRFAEMLKDLQAENARLRGLLEAVTPSAETKAAYIGEFHFETEGTDGRVVTRTVPWTATKEIMAAIRKRAGIDDAALKGAQ